MEIVMTSEELEKGLEERGFVGIEDIDSMGECHKDQHYILRTDGLIIYSNIPHWSDHKHYPNAVYNMWPQEDYSDEFYKDPNPIFTWKELDQYL